MAQSLLSPESLETFREIQSDDDPDFIRNFFSSLLEPLPDRFREIEAAIGAKDFPQLKSSAHAIKSSCSNVGAEAIVSICVQLEELGRNEKIENASELSVELKSLLDDLKAEVLNLEEFQSI